MALLSLSVKRHLGEDFPIAPPSPPQSPLFCSSPIRLLSSLHTSSLTSLPESHVKKRRKQEHPLFLTDSLYAVDGINAASVDGLEKSNSSEAGIKEEVAASSMNAMQLSKVDDVDVTEMERDWPDSDHFDGPNLANKETETVSSQSFDVEKPGNRSAAESTVPLLLLSQVAADAIGQLSPLKLQPDIITSLKQEEEFPAEHQPSSEGELPEGDPITDDGPTEVCPDCKKVFKRKIYLQRHIAREHWSLAKIFKCEKCAYETKHQSNLLVHRRTHTGERPYHCGACGQRYTQGHLLKAHIRSRHGADMRFYNMDKRTDGMRCRRLLGAKLLGGGGKEDRIRFLLQAAEAARQHPSPPPPRPMFGGMIPPGLNQYMNVLSCLPNGMRPMLWPSLSLSAAPGSLLGSSGFQSNPLQNGMPSHAALLSSLAAPLSLTGGKMPQTNDIGSKATGGSILSSMLALPSSTMSFQAIKTENFPDDQIPRAIASSPERSGGAQKSFCAPVMSSLDFSAMPEDLTTTRRSATNKESSCKSPDKDKLLLAQSLDFGQYPFSRATSSSLSLGGDCENISATDLSSRDSAKVKDMVANQSSSDSKVLFPSSSSTRCFVDKSDNNGLHGINPSQLASLTPDEQQLLLSWNNTRLASFLARSELFPSSSQSSYMSFVKPPLYPGHSDSVHGQLQHNTKSPSPTVAEKTIIQVLPSHDGYDQAAGEVDQSKLDDAKPLSQCHSTCAGSGNQCKESCCPYLKKLKDLRRNVYRMLCVFTPYLGVADINDYEADSIDEFLHEVIYSKLDDTD